MNLAHLAPLTFVLALVACSGASDSPSNTGTGTGSESSEPSGAEPGEVTATDEVAATEPVCGSRGSAPCPTGTFCDFTAGSNCGADDRGGRCTPVPSACTREYRPVCGCDGQTYATGCTANAASVSVAHDGPC